MNDAVWFYLSARNLAISEGHGLDMLPLCNGCYASLNEVKFQLDNDEGLKKQINEKLALEGLHYDGKIRVRHILEVLNEDIGVEKIRDSVKRPLEGLNIATHSGCHATRPSEVRYTDDPEDPKILDAITNSLGAKTSYYPEKLDCCGANLIMTNYEEAFKLTGTKLQSVKKRGFDALVTNCPFCFKMYDSRQDAVSKVMQNSDVDVPVFYVTQLIGIALGFGRAELGLNFNVSPCEDILDGLGVQE
jgi:heterodisulfide reductase subunit B